mmetsp:Transcript_57047/g.148225  ORF Transcript_57047/g.148225 Transcript_57047/m.148225 type:complete len:107 (+) Transcript_57047:64-384(+)
MFPRLWPLGLWALAPWCRALAASAVAADDAERFGMYDLAHAGGVRVLDPLSARRVLFEDSRSGGRAARAARQTREGDGESERRPEDAGRGGFADREDDRLDIPDQG